MSDGPVTDKVPQTPDMRFRSHRAMYMDALDRLYESATTYHGKVYRPRLEKYEAAGIKPPLGIPMSFSRTLLHLVGGLEMLDAMWEPETCSKCGSPEHAGWEHKP